MKKKPVILAVVLIIALCAVYLLARPALARLSDFLSKSEKVSGNILIIEGWLPPDDLRYAVAEYRMGGYDRVITTGLKATPDYYGVYTDGFLIFYTHGLISGNESKFHTFEVKARSELGGENSAHFRLWVNDSIAGEFTASRHKKIFGVTVKKKLASVDSVMIEFTNDLVDDSGDRNLLVKEITIDKKITIPYLNHSVYDILKPGGNDRIVNNISSNAEMTAKRLMSLGIDSTIIIPVPGNKAKINRTLASAIAFRDWLNETNLKVRGINIISEGTHARRTWMTFDKVLGSCCKIGVISLPDHKHNRSGRMKLLKLARETAAYLYYCIILIPY